MAVSFPSWVPLCRVVIDQITTALDVPGATALKGEGTVTADHDRYREPTTPGGADGLYIDNNPVPFKIENGRGEFTAPSSDIDGFDWTNVRYEVALKVGVMSLPAKTLWLPRGTTSDGGATWTTPTISYFAEDSNYGAGSPQGGALAAQVLTLLGNPRTPWSSGTSYTVGSNVTYGTGLYTALQAIPASTSPPGVAAGWWLTGYDPDA